MKPVKLRIILILHRALLVGIGANNYSCMYFDENWMCCFFWKLKCVKSGHWIFQTTCQFYITKIMLKTCRWLNSLHNIFKCLVFERCQGVTVLYVWKHFVKFNTSIISKTSSAYTYILLGYIQFVCIAIPGISGGHFRLVCEEFFHVCGC